MVRFRKAGGFFGIHCSGSSGKAACSCERRVPRPSSGYQGEGCGSARNHRKLRIRSLVQRRAARRRGDLRERYASFLSCNVPFLFSSKQQECSRESSRFSEIIRLPQQVADRPVGSPRCEVEMEARYALALLAFVAGCQSDAAVRNKPPMESYKSSKSADAAVTCLIPSLAEHYKAISPQRFIAQTIAPGSEYDVSRPTASSTVTIPTRSTSRRQAPARRSRSTKGRPCCQASQLRFSPA